MAKGGNNKRSNNSRFSKPYDVSNSFVTKVASRVSDYFGGWFGTPKTSETSLIKKSENKICRAKHENLEVKESSSLSKEFFTMKDTDAVSSSKRLKMCETEKINIDFPISPIPSTSGVLQYNINNNYDISKNENFMRSETNSISISNEAYLHTNVPSHPTSSVPVDIKSNGATDNHSDSSESTSGCSSLVPQCDRLSQSAFQYSNSRKRNLEEKLKYARQLQQSRAAMFLNRSIPNDVLNTRKKPSFDVTAYKAVTMDKSLFKESFNCSPFYTGQTSYGGASAYKTSKNSLYAHKTSKSREPMQVLVKPSRNSSEDLTNMSHTAKKILEALEQFSTPITDAKRIPVNKLMSLGLKRQQLNDLSETKLSLSKPVSPLNPSPGPVIAVLNVPTVPDLLKLKRLERIQNSTAAARQIASPKQEYTLPNDSKIPVKRTGKMVMKLKNKEKDIFLEKPEKVSLPSIPLPITTLPKFDFKLPPAKESATCKTEELKFKDRQFKFSAPIPVTVVSGNVKQQILKSGFTFSSPLDTTTQNIICKDVFNHLPNIMTSDAVTQLKRKSINDCDFKSNFLKSSNDSAQDKAENALKFLKENKININKTSNLSFTWECSNCFIRNLNDTKICCACKCERILDNKGKNSAGFLLLEEQKQEATCSLGFADKFKPPNGSWECKECYVSNKEFASKCVACEAPKPLTTLSNKVSPQKLLKPSLPANGFGDKFKKQDYQWECSVCMLLNMESATKCVACENPKPVKKPENTESKFFCSSKPVKKDFAFGNDKTDVENVGIKSVADSSTFKNYSNSSNFEVLKNSKPQFNTITTSVGIFTFGIPPTVTETTKEQFSKSKDNVTSNNRFQVTSTSGFGARQDESSSLVKSSTIDEKEKILNSEKSLVSSKNLFSSTNDIPKSLGPETNNNSSNAFLKDAVEENKVNLKEPENKNTKFFFGLSSEAVSSSTVDSTFGQKKSETSSSTLDQSNVTTFQFNSLGKSEPTTFQTASNISLEKNKPEVKLLSPVSVTPTSLPQIFNSISSSNNSTSKIAFPNAATSNSSLNIREGNLTNSLNYSSVEQPFPSSNFNSGDSMKETLTNSFEITAQQNEKSTMENCSNFETGLFTNTTNPFSSTLTSPNQLTSKSPFGAIEQNSSIPTFSSNPTSTFGDSNFIPSNEINKASQPFIFGASVSSVTSTATSGPHIFTFGASKQEVKPSVFTFGQSGAPNCSFESNAQTNLFGNFSQLKTDASMGLSGVPFGSSASTFGQNTAPASFEPSAQKFEFGASTQQQITPTLFQFSAASAPASAPPSTNFSLSVPQKFNFSTGLTSVVSSESQSAVRPVRKVIRAVRRTNPRRTN